MSNSTLIKPIVNRGSISVSNTGTPSTPTGVLALASEAKALVYFNLSSGAISYTATSSPGGFTATGTSSPLTVTGLTNGVAYTFTVSATNANGSAISSASNSITPTALPGALTGLTGLICWYDASQITPQSDATALTTWLDASGNGYTATQSTAAQKPLYNIAASWGGGTTGKPAVTFDGQSTNGDNMATTLTSTLVGPEATIFVVACKSASTNTNSVRDQRVISNESTRADRGFCVAMSDSTGSSGNDCFSVRGCTTEINATSVVSNNVANVMSVVTGAQVFLNGTRQAPQGLAVSPLLNRKTPFTLGAAVGNAGSVGLVGQIAEIMIWKGRLSDANRQTVEAYLCSKYNLSAPAAQATL